jgi:hypothetical protein
VPVPEGEDETLVAPFPAALRRVAVMAQAQRGAQTANGAGGEQPQGADTQPGQARNCRS